MVQSMNRYDRYELYVLDNADMYTVLYPEYKRLQSEYTFKKSDTRYVLGKGSNQNWSADKICSILLRLYYRN